MIKVNQTSDNTIRNLILAGEILALNMALLTMFYIYHETTSLVPPHYKRLMLLMTLVYIISEFNQPSMLEQRFVRYDQLAKRLFTHLIRFTAASLLVLWVFRWPLMTLHFMVPFYTFIFVFISAYRWGVRQAIKFLRTRGRNTMSVLFVGDISIASDFYLQTQNDTKSGLKLKGYFADEPKTEVTDKGYLGKPEEAVKYIEEHPNIHNVYCMLPSTQNSLINQLMRTCDQSMVRYNHIPDVFNYKRHNMSLSVIQSVPVFTLRYEPLTFLTNRMMKRTFDIVFSLVVLLTVFPIIYVIVGFLIKRSSPGPIFFKQKRSGMEGKEFYCYKFRSMKVNVDSDTKQATKDDPRKTRIGEFIRKTSIDELPQFINVLKGEMSIVGPRPHMLKHTEQYSELISSYMVRHLAKPGITGWAQVNGARGETHELWQMEDRVKKDIWYIEHWSLMLDIIIIWKTIFNAMRGEKNAY